jgi:trehalose 6-phosphate synthase/phosphatase
MNYESRWFGASGFDEKELSPEMDKQIREKLDKENCEPLHIPAGDQLLYYSGFSNKTIWPLFHYFLQYTVFEEEYWEAYVRVNKQFAREMRSYIKSGDKIWIHDYHLLLLPQMIREDFPDVNIGFFLHIPFPSFELFRMLPWRKEILSGMLGADLIGFHSYDYERHFLSSVKRLFGYETYLNQIKLHDRIVKMDAFPMGIDYEKFRNAAIELANKPIEDQSEIKKELDHYRKTYPGRKLILSIDRLDYSKGIPHRLRAYEHFLKKYPAFREKVTLVMLSVPSRVDVEQYQMMKREIDELVGRINGEFASINWTPIWYFYRSMPFENLIELYSTADVALITPVRDGMNLVAKEYLATRIDGSGVLILGEMAGAYKELNEALIINPNDKDEIAENIKTALEMPVDVQVETNRVLQERIKNYDVKRWASDFILSLENMKILRERYLSQKISPEVVSNITREYQKAQRKGLILDYDGTLVDYERNPQKAKPDEELYEILDHLSGHENSQVILVTGRNKNTFDEWFSSRNYTLIAEHGAWIKEPDSDWKKTDNGKMNNEWKELIIPVMNFTCDRTPGSIVEEKSHSIAWHYSNSDPDQGLLRAMELKEELNSLISNLNLEVVEGNKFLEIKNSAFNKGKAAMEYSRKHSFDFILAIGDDYTDEYLYEELPDFAFTLKVGHSKTLAKYSLESFKEARSILKKIKNTLNSNPN